MNWDNIPSTLLERVTLLKRFSYLLKSPGKKGRILRRVLRETQQEMRNIQETARQADPLSVFKPSYEQSLILNCWMYGIQFIATYTANRIGKTVAHIVNFILWIFPNKPAWRSHGVFKPYKVGDPIDDPDNQDNPNAGKLVQVFPRPSYEYVQLIHHTLVRLNLRPDPSLPPYDPINAPILRKLAELIPEAFAPAFPYAPWNQGGTCWMGAPDQKHHEDKIMPIWRKFLPASSLTRYVPTEREITITTQANIDGSPRKTCWEIIGLSFEQKETKWSSGAVEAILITEGIPSEVFKEAKLRFTSPGLGAHDFTPYDPANSSSTVALAQRIMRGTEGMPLPTHVFQKFTVYAAPRHILPKDKQEGLIKSFKDDPQGKARLDGEFYSSSALVLSNISPPGPEAHHLLDIDLPTLFKLFPTGRLYRGIDPGLDHPTACVWALLTPTNQWIVYRIMSERGLDIPTRCRKIVELSGNVLAKKRYGKDPNHYYLIESHPFPTSEVFSISVSDYHMFKTDETNGQPYVINYTVAGLSLTESVHTRPELRAVEVNSALKISPYLPDLKAATDPFATVANSPNAIPLQGAPPKQIQLPLTKPPGARLYFLRQGEGVMDVYLKWQDLYWDRVKQGENKGQPNDKVPIHGDDELDALSYLVCSPYRWTNHVPKRIVGDSEPEFHLSTAHAQKVLSNQQIRHFGSLIQVDEDEREWERSMNL